jgi:hypothetical protein
MGVATKLDHERPGTTEAYAAFHPDYLKDGTKALDKLVQATCAPLLTRQNIRLLGIRGKFSGMHGGRTRDRTLDLSRVKGTLSR